MPWLSKLLVLVVAANSTTPKYFYSDDDNDFYTENGLCTADKCEPGPYMGGACTWICAVMGSSSGKAVSGCSWTGTPKAGFTSSTAAATTKWTGTKATSTGTCPWSGSKIARIDPGTSNDNAAGGESLAMEKSCADHGTGFEAFVSVGGGDIKNDQLNIKCNNKNDDESLRVYFVCCKPGDCNSCVDPVVGSTTDTQLSDTTSRSSGTASSDTVVVAVAASAAGLGLIGAAAAFVVRRRATRTTQLDDKHAVQLSDDAGEV